jgi:Fe-S-cluster containining protein
MFPKKFHATIHSFVKELVPNDWKDKDECIFLKDNKCIIYADRPLACISFPPPMIESCKEVKNITDSDRIAFQIYNDMKIKDYHQIAKDREMLSKLIQKAKERASKKELKEMFEVDLNAEKKEM